jgi:hypothetical protein
MTTLTPILFCDGAVRLTQHGPKAGGTAVVFETKHNGTAQIDLADEETAGALDLLDQLAGRGWTPSGIYSTLNEYHREGLLKGY